MAVYISGLLMTVLLMMGVKTYIRSNLKRIAVSLGGHLRIRLPHVVQIIPMIPLTVIAAIRYGVGQDYFYTYTRIFEKVVAGRSEEAWGDIGYTFLNKIVAVFSQDYASIFIVTSIIFCVCIFYAIYCNSDDIVLSSFLLVCSGYYFCFLNGIRQMMAVSILMISLKYVREKKGLRFAICILLASLLHLTSVVFIPVYFMDKLKLTNRKRLLIVVLCYVLSGPLSSLISKIIMLTKYSWYITDSYSVERVGYVSTLLGIGILCFACIFSTRKNALLIDIQMIAVCINAFIGRLPLASRMVWLFGMSVIFLIPNTLESIENAATRRIIKAGAYILYFIYFIYIIGVKNSNNVLPYRTIFSR